MAEDFLLNALESDFDNILLVDLDTGEFEIKYLSDKGHYFEPGESVKNFNDYIAFLTNLCFYPEDRQKFISTFTLENIKKNLTTERVFMYNHRVYNINQECIFYQTKIARYGDSVPPHKFVFGGHSIDRVHHEQILNLEQEATARHNAVIASLASDFELICYVNRKSREVIKFYSTEIFDSVITKCDASFSPFERLDFFFQKFVHPDDMARFREDCAFSTILRELEIYPSYEIHFRALIGGEVYYYKIRFVPDQKNPDGIILGLMSFDEQVRTQIQRREQEKARQVIEKQLELMIVERTSEIQAKNKTLNRINEDIIEMLGDITEARDIESGEHIRRVKGFTHILARQVMRDWPEYNLTTEKVELMSSAAALHDIGKIMIPDTILLKPGRLTPEEFEIMKTHSVKGCELLKKAPKDWSASYLEMSMEICRYHHEKYDGKGYPEGLVGEQIPISAQIVSVADCYDALTAKRVYKEALSPDIAFEMITTGKCGAFSEKIMSSFLKCRECFTDKDFLNGLPEYSTMPISTCEQLSHLRVLFVEDSEMSRMIGREMLEGEGATVIEAKNGKEAIDLFCNMAPHTFDAIIMDVMMPVLDGPAATKHIRSLDRIDAKSIPIVALTASEKVSDLQSCLSAGMDSYLSKPVKIAELTELLIKLCGKKK